MLTAHYHSLQPTSSLWVSSSTLLPARAFARHQIESRAIRASFSRCRQTTRSTALPTHAMHVVAAASVAGPAASAVEEDLSQGLPGGFSDRYLNRFGIGIMGDLHLEPGKLQKFEEAQAQFRQQLLADDTDGARIVQLGDLGGYNSRPGSRESLQLAADFLEGFGLPQALVVGNHDLEGADFQTDEANLQAWQEILGQRHYWAAHLGRVTCIGLSTVRFRSNRFSVHEVFIDDEQLAWFERTLVAAGERPVIVFTHAPPMGSGLQVVQEVHVKNRCAWLNHSSNPEAFMSLVERHQNIKLWFSGHFHLSHNYPDSISVVGGCAFVQTGVIGDCNRDGHRQSRLLKGDEAGYQLYTLDHETGSLRLDLEHRWDCPDAPQPALHEDDLLCDAASGGWLCSQLSCDVGDNPLTPQRNTATWFAVGARTAVARQAHMLVEYDVSYRSPIGLVCNDMEEQEAVVLLDAAERRLTADGSDSKAGEDVAFIELQRPDGYSRRFERNSQDGMWYRIYQKNKWQARVLKEQQEKQAAAPV